MLSKLRFKASLFEGVLDGGADAVFLGDDHFEGLLSGLSNYMEESETATAEAISQADEEQPVRREPVQTVLAFEEAKENGGGDGDNGSNGSNGDKRDNGLDGSDGLNRSNGGAEPTGFHTDAEASASQQPLLQRFASNLSELLLADEDTRRRAAQLLASLKL